LEWRKADLRLLKPGMHVKVMYHEKDEIKHVYGRLINMHASVQKLGYGNSQNQHQTSCALHVFYNEPTEKPL
ncbi:hypothetical protein ACXWOR_10690, partial [Streptococcus pyogenes]